MLATFANLGRIGEFQSVSLGLLARYIGVHHRFAGGVHWGTPYRGGSLLQKLDFAHNRSEENAKGARWIALAPVAFPEYGLYDEVFAKLY
jgi:hypothetical protein